MLLEVKNLSHGFSDKVLYKDASFRVLEKEKIGIIGANGAGKSTLIKILCGEIIHDSGTIEFNKNIKVGYLDQYQSIDKNLTIYNYLKTAFSRLDSINDEIEELSNKINQKNGDLLKLTNRIHALQTILDDNDYYQINTKINKIATGLGIVNYGLDKKISILSGGQKVKVILAKLLLEVPDLLILDEPTNFLDTIHVEWLTKFLKEYKGSFLIVSHNQEFLNDTVNAIIEIDHLKITKYKGNYLKYVEKKKQIEDNLGKAYIKQQKQIEKLTDFVNKNIVRATTSNMAKSRQKVLAKMELVKIEKPTDIKVNIHFNYIPISSHKFLEIKDLEVGYFGYSLLPKMDLLVKSGEKIAITGFNGIGKTTLIKTLVKEIPPIKGSFNFVDNAKIAYFAQEFEFSEKELELTCVNYIQNIYPTMSNGDIRKELARVGIKDKLALQPLKTLSGGESCKLRLCLLSLIKANCLILDEPTNHLDKSAKEGLKKALKEYNGTVIIVTHEEDFLNHLVNRVYNIEDLLVN